MTFWQENYAFIKDVYDTRASKLAETMSKTEKSIADVVADKIYTSAEFKKVKEIFMGLAKSLEQPEVKEWLASTKDTLMGDKPGKDQDEEAKKLNEILLKYDSMMPKIAETKNIVDALWKSYQFTDELAPLMEWLEEMVSKSTRDINSNSASQTEEIMEKQEKVLDQLDKKKKVVMEQQSKGEKILQDPKAPKFLISYLDRLKALWTDANKQGEDRLVALKDNLSAWERYERERDALCSKLDGAEGEMMDTKRVYDLVEGPKDYQQRLKTAADMRKDIENTFKTVSGANDILAKLLSDDKKAELAEEVDGLKSRMSICDNMDEKLKGIDDFNKQLKEFDAKMKELSDWLGVGRKRMDELMKPAVPISAEDRVVQTMELLTDCKLESEKLQAHVQHWGNLQPSAAGEDTKEAQGFVARMNEVQDVQGKLIAEVDAEGAKYGDDVKYLADFTSGVKKFDPWIQKSEAKKAVGMSKPGNLDEALAQLADASKWKKESEDMKALLEEAYKAALKMTLHDDADTKYAAFIKRWAVIDETAKEWVGKLDSMVVVWKKQAETVEKVQAAISAKPSADGGEMKLEDLEKHLDLLKQMFIEKQKMMENLQKSDAPPAAAAPAPAPTPAAT